MPKAARHLEQAVMRGAPSRLAMRFYRQCPVTTGCLDISATKSRNAVIPPADDNAFNGSLSDRNSGDGMAEKADCGSAKAGDPASLHPNAICCNSASTLLFLELVAIFSATWRTRRCETGVAGSVSSWTHAAYLF